MMAHSPMSLYLSQQMPTRVKLVATNRTKMTDIQIGRLIASSYVSVPGLLTFSLNLQSLIFFTFKFSLSVCVSMCVLLCLCVGGWMNVMQGQKTI